MVTRFTDLIVTRASSVVNVGVGVGRAGPNTGEIGGIVVEVGVGAGLECEEKHLDDNLVHGRHPHCWVVLSTMYVMLSQDVQTEELVQVTQPGIVFSQRAQTA